MKRLVRFLLPSLAIAFSGVAVSIQPATASLGVPGIEIEAKSPYCPPGEQGGDGGDRARQAHSDEEGNQGNCANNPNLTAAGIDYALVNTYTFAPRVKQGRDGQIQGASGSVDFANVVCAHGLDALRLTVGGPAGGTVRGFNRLGKNPTETNPRALGETAFWASDGSTIAIVRGAPISFNPDLPPPQGDHLVAGGVEIWMSGLIQNFATGARHQGTLTCTTSRPALYQPLVLDPTAPPPDNLVAPPYFESVLNLGADPDNS